MQIELLEFVSSLEENLGLTAIKKFQSIQPGDVVETYADIHRTKEALGYKPKVSLSSGLNQWVSWFKRYSNGEISANS